MNHLAVIMDGNRRWARQRGKFPWYGHRAGIEAVRRVGDFCLKKGIAYLSLYTFSIENFKRDPEEYSYLFSMLADVLVQERARFIEDGIRIVFVGDRTLFPSSLMPIIQETEEKTAHGKKLQVNILFCYGGQQEIVDGVKSVVRAIQSGKLKEDELSIQTFEQYLWFNQCPPPDLVVRTGGVSRLSNFLLFHTAYSELYFLDCLWPDIKAENLEQAMQYYEHCSRNFGY
jgi:undecaprenyl diphosphate synthase